MSKVKKPSISLQRKLSAKIIMGGDVKKAATGDLFQIVGIAKGTKVVQTGFGESEGLKGQFRAVNVKTGEIFDAPVAYLPGLAHDLIAPNLADNDAVEFAFMIGKVEDETSAVGYSYAVKPLIETKPENDPLTRLMAALPAPE